MTASAFPLQPLQGDPLQVRVVPVEGLPRHLLVGVPQARVVQAHARRQPPEEFLPFGAVGEAVAPAIESDYRLLKILS